MIAVRNMAFYIGLIISITVLTSYPAQAAIESFEFDNAQQEQTFYELTKLLRCPKCQNQNIADSNAELAKDLRNKAYQLVKQGQTKEQVVDYMVTRFGNFVRYDPPLTPATIFLWLGPLLFVMGGVFILVKQVKTQTGKKQALAPQEKQKLASLLAQHDRDSER